MYDKIKISIPEGLFSLLKKDAEDFRILKANGECNMNAFMNRLIVNFYEIFAADEEELREKLQKALSGIPKAYAKGVYEEIVKAIADREKDGGKEGKSVSLAFKPTKATEDVVAYIENMLIRNESLSSFYRRLLSAYAKRTKNEREKIIHKENYGLLTEALEKGVQAYVTLDSGQTYQAASVYAVASAKDELYNYALLYSEKKNRTVRLAKIRSVTLLGTRGEIPEENRGMFARQVENGAQYPIYATDNEPIRVQLSEKGRKLFEKIYLYRPTPVSIEGDIYTFRCSANQILYYFERFGEEALILTPKKLGIFMRNYYYFALKKYRTRYSEK